MFLLDSYAVSLIRFFKIVLFCNSVWFYYLYSIYLVHIVLDLWSHEFTFPSYELVHKLTLQQTNLCLKKFSGTKATEVVTFFKNHVRDTYYTVNLLIK